ncbi:protein microrchidia 7 isoform X1 [Tanacetum coccineum]
MDTKTTKHESSTEVVEDIQPMITDDCDGNTNKHCLDTNGTVHERPMKKPKIEVLLPEGFLDPIIRDKQQPMVVDVPVSSTVGENGVRVNEKKKEVASSLSKQFWKAGDYESCGNNSETVVLPGGMDHLRVHPRFLHSNATSHKWALGAFAELLDNSLDEVRTGATYVKVDVLNNEKDTRSKMLLIEDNGGGMTPDKMRGCMSLGYSEKSKLANTIGQYGNGFKTSTMRLGADVLVFTRNGGQDFVRPTQSIGMLSYTFLMETGKQDIVVPMKKGEEWGTMLRSSADDWKKNMDILVQWSPYTSEEHLLQQFDHLDDQGTRIIIYNIWEDEGQLELDFDTDMHDIQIRGARDSKKIEMAKDYPNSRHFLTYRHSFRSYASILYLRIPDNFRIILRGKDVIHHNIVNDMMMSQKITYKPAQPTADGVTKNDKNKMSADVTIGFVKDAKDHIDVQGFNVYHKNRLIKPFWRVWNAAGSDGRGVIGVLEADFVEPAHDKQGFERTTVLQRLENRLVIMQKKYWSTNCQHIGYAKRIKSAPDAKSKPSVGDLSDEDIVSPGTNTNSYKREVVRPIRNSAASKSVEYAQYDAMPEACASTSRKSSFQASSSSKVLKASTNSLHSKVINQAQPLNAFGYVSVDPKVDIVQELRKENHELKQRGGGTDSEMINSLLQDLLYERDKNALLEKQLQNAEEKIQEAEKKIKKLDEEHEAIIEIFSDERSRQYEMESNLMKKWQDAMNTVEELRKQLENSKVRT